MFYGLMPSMLMFVILIGLYIMINGIKQRKIVKPEKQVILVGGVPPPRECYIDPTRFFLKVNEALH